MVETMFPRIMIMIIVSTLPKSLTLDLQLQVSLPPLPLIQQPLIFLDQRLEIVYPVIQTFKTLITSDPFNITASWIGPDICKYKGFYCESPPHNLSAIALASIDFNGFHLSSPTLVGFLDLLPDLAIFHANSNNFGGILPPGIANLPYLYELDLSNNKFSGPFPGFLSLSFLDIRFNSFSGSIPPQLFANNMEALFLNDNDFNTRLPDNVGTSRIKYLTLANNKLSGQIPTGIVKSLSGLSEVLVFNNVLSGCLPNELGLLEEAVLIDAGNNNLTGPLPSSIGCLKNLENLNLAGNFLYGNLPEVVCGLEKLGNLSVSDNYLTAVGSSCLGLIEKGVVDVRRNCIPGQRFQRSAAECSAFFAVPRNCPNSDMYSRVLCRNSRV